jgi:hypothetical protein
LLTNSGHLRVIVWLMLQLAILLVFSLTLIIHLLLSNVKTVPKRDQDPLHMIIFSQIFPKNENFETFYFH